MKKYWYFMPKNWKPEYIRQNSRTSSRFVLRLKWVFRVKLIIHYYIFCWSYGYIINVCPITSSLYYFRDFPTFRFIYLTFCLLFLPLWAELLLFRREDFQQTEMNKTFWNPKSFVSFFLYPYFQHNLCTFQVFKN